MTLTLEEQIGQQLMLAFEGKEAPARVLSWIGERSPAGFTLFRPKNVANPAQIRRLTASLQAAASEAGYGPLLIATDQEGGQLVALGDETTQFPGNMALGATRDPDLARRVGAAIGRELAAMGINVNYIPDSDVNTNPANPNVGVRSFGDDPQLVAGMVAAMTEGLQSAGVAATAKHFPGNGDSSLDPHFGVPVLNHDAAHLEQVDFLPFRAAIQSGVRLMMTAHVGLPSLTGRADLPATLSPDIMQGILRQEMGFKGLLITDALDMEAITQGAGQLIDVVAALRAGVDLLLLTGDPEVQERIYAGLNLAYSRGLLCDEHLEGTLNRLATLRTWLSGQSQPGLEVIGSAEHHRLSETVARRSITLVKDEAGLLPLNLGADERIAAIMPRPADLTPADTSSYVEPALARSLQSFHPNVDEFIVSQQPSSADIAALRGRLDQYDLLVIGTTSAQMQPAQATMVNELLHLALPTVTVAMRTPYDITVFPRASTYVCTYSIQPVAMQALAAALWGAGPLEGHLPVRLSL